MKAELQIFSINAEQHISRFEKSGNTTIPLRVLLFHCTDFGQQKLNTDRGRGKKEIQRDLLWSIMGELQRQRNTRDHSVRDCVARHKTMIFFVSFVWGGQGHNCKPKQMTAAPIKKNGRDFSPPLHVRRSFWPQPWEEMVSYIPFYKRSQKWVLKALRQSFDRVEENMVISSGEITGMAKDQVWRLPSLLENPCLLKIPTQNVLCPKASLSCCLVVWCFFLWKWEPV